MTETAVLIRDFKDKTEIGSLRFTDACDDHPFGIMGASQTWHLIHPGLEYAPHADVPLNTKFFEAARSMKDRAMTAPENGKDYLLVSATAALVYRYMLKHGTAGFMRRTQADDKKNRDVQMFQKNLDTIITVATKKYGPDLEPIQAAVNQSFCTDFSKRMDVA